MHTLVCGKIRRFSGAGTESQGRQDSLINQHLRAYRAILGGETRSISTSIERRRFLASLGMTTGRLEVRRQLV